MEITNAQYLPTPFEGDEPSTIKANIDGIEMAVPIHSSNRHYAEILKQVEAGTLTIQEASD
jgi:hypothetical protein